MLILVNYDSTFCWIWFLDQWILVWTKIFISVSKNVKTLAHLQWYCNFAPRNWFIFSHQRWLSMREEVIMCTVHSWTCFCTICVFLQPTVVMQMKLFWSMSIGHFSALNSCSCVVKKIKIVADGDKEWCIRVQ